MAEFERKMITDTDWKAGVQIERDGVSFRCYAKSQETPELILYKKGTEEIAAEIPFQKPRQPGAPWELKISLKTAQYEYNFREGKRIITDPYARKIVGREVFGSLCDVSDHSVRGGFTSGKFDWGDDRLPQIPFSEVIMYHLHVRGFTMQKNSAVRRKGTFAGLEEKIAYLKELGVNQVKLMPVYEFQEMTDLNKLNYWGYGDGFYYAPKASFAHGKNPEEELKHMIKAFHAAGMEVILEFFFPDTMGLDQIADCLHYWAFAYHADGFAVIGRDTLHEELAKLPIFQNRKLICTWYSEDVIRKNTGDGQRRLASSNDGFMIDCRRMLKGEEHALAGFAYRLRCNPEGCAQINYITNHDGFTLQDLVSYEEKHNEANEEQGWDGADCNYSWNCGIEGPTRKKDILALRMRQRKNAYAMLLFSQGVPMLLAGDEFGNSQQGNNNPYCHDSELSWTDWSVQKRNHELSEFVKKAIAFRKAHKVLHQEKELQCLDYRAEGMPDLSFHSEKAWYGDLESNKRYIGSMFFGAYASERGVLYIAWNFHWNEQCFALPILPKGSVWYKVMDTSWKESFPEEEDQVCMEETKLFSVPARTIVILEGRER